jgi:predicted nucleotidyltransferase
MLTESLLNEIKANLQQVHGQRLLGIVLYGSVARGEAGDESDIDVLVLLADPVNYGRDLEANLRALFPLAMRLGRRISAKPVSARDYDTVDCPLYANAHREGTAA